MLLSLFLTGDFCSLYRCVQPKKLERLPGEFACSASSAPSSSSASLRGAFLCWCSTAKKTAPAGKRLFLLLGVPLSSGGVRAINYLVEMILFFGFVYCWTLTLLGAWLPRCLLQLSRRKQTRCRSGLLYAGMGTALSVTTLIVTRVHRKRYTTFNARADVRGRSASLAAVLRHQAPFEPLPAYAPKPGEKARRRPFSAIPVHTPDKSGKIGCLTAAKVAVGTTICRAAGVR